MPLFDFFRKNGLYRSSDQSNSEESHGHQFVKTTDAFGDAAVICLILNQTDLRGCLQKAHDMLPVDESFARQEMFINQSMIIMEMAVDDLRQEFLQRLFIPTDRPNAPQHLFALFGMSRGLEAMWA